MKKVLIFSALLLLASGSGQAQETGHSNRDLGNMEIEYELFKANMYTGHIEQIEQAIITVPPEDPSEEPIKLKAKKVTFSYTSDDAKTPDSIVFIGDVNVKHTTALITSDKAVWDYAANVFEFTGTPSAKLSSGGKLESRKPGGKLTLNLDTGEVIYQGPGIARDFSEMGGKGRISDPSLLQEKDILNWSAFLDEFKAQGSSSAVSPGKHIMLLLDDQTRSYLTNMPTDEILKSKKNIVKQLNKVLIMPEFYNKTAWNEIVLRSDIISLLDKSSGTLSKTEQTRLNRLLLEAAYPKYIQKGSQ